MGTILLYAVRYEPPTGGPGHLAAAGVVRMYLDFRSFASPSIAASTVQEVARVIGGRLVPALRLVIDHAVPDGTVLITERDGVVVLSGRVGTRRDRDNAGFACWAICGTIAVQNDLALRSVAHTIINSPDDSCVSGTQ